MKEQLLWCVLSGGGGGVDGWQIPIPILCHQSTDEEFVVLCQSISRLLRLLGLFPLEWLVDLCVWGDVRNPKQTITQKNLLLTNDKSTDPSHNNPPPPLTYLPTYLPLALWVLSEKGSPKNAITTARTDWDWMTDSVLCTTLVNASFNVCATQFA